MLQKKKKTRSKIRVNKGDNVLVISGSASGKSGIVTSVDRTKMRVTVEGLNIRKKAVKPTDENNKGGIIEIEGPIHISNVKLQKTES